MTLTVIGLLSLVSIASADEGTPYDGPIFDAHVHYNRAARDVVPVSEIITKWDAAGVIRSLVSSTPDDGTLKLLEAAPDRVVPFFRPYRKSTDSGGWYKKPELIPYSEQRLNRGPYVGLGEIHIIRPEHIQMPVVRRHLEMGKDRGFFIQIHTDATILETLLKTEPRLKIIWAHAGFDASPAVIGAIMDAHPFVWADLSLRASDIMGEEGLDPAWQELLTRHADRFMIGTDTYLTSRWQQYEALVADHRMWLSLLPHGIAELVAYKNSSKIFATVD